MTQSRHEESGGKTQLPYSSGPSERPLRESEVPIIVRLRLQHGYRESHRATYGRQQFGLSDRLRTFLLGFLLFGQPPQEVPLLFEERQDLLVLLLQARQDGYDESRR